MLASTRKVSWMCALDSSNVDHQANFCGQDIIELRGCRWAVDRRQNIVPIQGPDQARFSRAQEQTVRTNSPTNIAAEFGKLNSTGLPSILDPVSVFSMNTNADFGRADSHTEPRSSKSGSNSVHSMLISVRSQTELMNALVSSKEARWIVLQGETVLAHPIPCSTEMETAYLSTKDIASFLGPKPYFGQGYASGSQLNLDNSQSVRHRGCNIMLLGFKEDSAQIDGQSPRFLMPSSGSLRTPYFSIDVSELEFEAELMGFILDDSGLSKAGHNLTFLHVQENPDVLLKLRDKCQRDPRVHEAREIQRWNARQQVCF